MVEASRASHVASFVHVASCDVRSDGLHPSSDVFQSATESSALASRCPDPGRLVDFGAVSGLEELHSEDVFPTQPVGHLQNSF